MRWTFWITLILLNSSTAEACTSSEMTKVRNLYHTTRTKSKLQNFITFIKNVDCKESKPYYASAIMQQAEYVSNPITKLKYFNRGKAMLESFIREYPHNLEARYVRILVQKNVPVILGYKFNITKDKEFILSRIKNSSLSPSYRKTILKHINV